jgi:hypothetical protein
MNHKEISTDEIKSTLDGCEFSSIRYGGVVHVMSGRAYIEGREIEDPNWNRLFTEYINEELF